MKDFTNYENWKNSHGIDMTKLEYAKPKDLFIYTRIAIKNPIKIESRQVVFAENESEALGYIRHIFLYDILNDIVDDLESDFKFSFEEKQEDAICIMNYWFKFGKLSKLKNGKQQIFDLCRKFNIEFSARDEVEYEIRVLDTAESLRKFLNSEYKNDINFDKKRLSNICSKDFFVGKLLKDFLKDLFDT